MFRNLLVASLEPRRASRAPRDLAQRLRAARASTSARRGVGIGVRAADRLGDDLVDDAGLEQIGRGQLQRLGGLDLLRRHRATGSPRTLPAG